MIFSKLELQYSKALFSQVYQDNTSIILMEYHIPQINKAILSYPCSTVYVTITPENSYRRP